MSQFNWHQEVKKRWDDNADFWNQNSENMWDSGSRSTIIPFFRKFINDGIHILDAGCGDGYGSYKLYLEGYSVTGVDISNEMIEKAQNRKNSKLTFLQGDLSSLPFEDNTFHAVMTINALEWTEDPLMGLNEIHRITKQNGHICVGLLGPTAGPRQNAYRRLYNEKVICNTMMPWEFEQLAIENGWTVIDGYGVYKNAVKEGKITGLPRELKQALTFMWVFILKKE